MKKSRALAVASFLLAAPLLAAAWAFFVEAASLTRRAETYAAWTGPVLKVAFFSDLHMGSPHIDRAYVDHLVSRINGENADLVLIGGDLPINGVLGGNWRPIEEIADALRPLRARLGVYAALGNHDWWNDGPHVRETLEAAGIRVLENQAVRLEGAFWLVGVGDAYTRHADLPKALERVPPREPSLLFMHDPAALLEIRRPFGLALAGHLHGGQIQLPLIGPLLTAGKAPKTWARGWARVPQGDLFVSKGVGTSIVPFRLGAAPEYVVIELGPQAKRSM